ncbi:universal stress protein [Candidatus Nitrosotalea bavarica]|uniref:universal stress protein n=1 Tax=Candidatus Nitrosotalea bavarica TaxID=1903277 RepID=UPI000C704CFA|nr:universal stress protein [Candidatus Nitrosotalea bavarica]
MVKSYSSILVPLDGSEYSKRALDEAIEISKRLDSEIELLAAVSASAARPAGIVLSGAVRGKGATKSIDAFVKKAVSESTGFMQECAAYCQNKGVKAIYKVVSDNPAKAILDHAKRNSNGLIVMGSQGLRGINKIKVLGSVSRQVLENASCPVVIVH